VGQILYRSLGPSKKRRLSFYFKIGVLVKNLVDNRFGGKLGSEISGPKHKIWPKSEFWSKILIFV